eukprot:COSAG06_NODE_3915_length_4773_cov_6.394309_1_plen_131_part_00
MVVVKDSNHGDVVNELRTPLRWAVEVVYGSSVHWHIERKMPPLPPPDDDGAGKHCNVQWTQPLRGSHKYNHPWQHAAQAAFVHAKRLKKLHQLNFHVSLNLPMTGRWSLGGSSCCTTSPPRCTSPPPVKI